MPWDLQITSPPVTPERSFRLRGIVDAGGERDVEGASVRVRSRETGWTEEVFLDPNGEFSLTLDLSADPDQDYELAVCDAPGRVVACVPLRIRYQSGITDEKQEKIGTSDSQTAAENEASPDFPWTTCAQRVRQCLHLAATVAQETGRDRDELLLYVHAQERYAEQAHQENNRTHYRECLENLEKYAAYLEHMREAAQPRPLQVAPAIIDPHPQEIIERLRTTLAAVWKEARSRKRLELEPKLKAVAAQAQGLGQRCKADTRPALEEAARLLAEIEAIEQQLRTAAPEVAGDPLTDSTGVSRV